MGRCLFCPKDASSAKKKAHISFALFGDDAVLPPGFECDSCNDTLSRVEGYFIGLFDHFRAVSGMVSRSGAPVAMDAGAWKMMGTEKAGDVIVVERRGLKTKATFQVDDVKKEFTVSREVRNRPHYISGCLSKWLLEYMALVEGKESALEPRLDPHRTNATRPLPDTYLPWAVRQDAMPPRGEDFVNEVRFCDHDAFFEVSIFNTRFRISVDPNLSLDSLVKDGFKIIRSPLIGTRKK